MSKSFVGVLVLLGVILYSDVVLGQANLYLPWTSWEQCSNTCGGGTRWRYRDCVDWGNPNCVDLWQSGTCNTQSCNGGAINGEWSVWSTWGSCSVTCGGGSRTRSRTCNNPAPSGGGRNCVGSSTQTGSCATDICRPRVDGRWSTWTSWGTCSVTCGGGTQSRSRTCTNPAPANGGQICVGSSTATQRCSTEICRPRVNGQWSTWTSWGACSVTCGGGTQSRSRTCTNPAPANGGQICVGSSTATQICSTEICRPRVDGRWSTWTSWGACSVTCGGGTQSRSRTCTNPAPANGGQNCVGSSTATQRCSTEICRPRVDGRWSTWTSWGACSVTCGGGTQSRSRTCTNPAPANGGQNCVGSSTATQRCSTEICRPRVDGRWSTWTSWGACSVTCGGGNQSRSRTCTNPAPANGGQNCVGSSTATQRCSTEICRPRVDGRWSTWTSWGACSVTCGGGTQSRSRTCTNPAPANGGQNCVGSSTATQRCSTEICRRCQAGQTVFDRCGQRCTCSSAGTRTQCTRIRREFTSMTTAQRARYIRTIKTASTDVRYKPRYDNLITLHRNFFFRAIHGIPNFLPWHRWYILQYENLLREVDCTFTVSYWDWSIVAGRPWGTTSRDLWFSGVDNSGFGGNGQGANQCVRTGPFRQGIWQLVPSVTQVPRCLRRAFNGNPSGAAEVASLLRLPASNVTEFQRLLEGDLHNTVHCLINGTMCDIDSASAPEFFLHHGMIDKIWEDWQKRSNAHRIVFFPGLTNAMPGTGGVLPGVYINNLALPGGVRAEWAPLGNPTLRRIESRLRTFTLQQLQMIPRVEPTPLSQRAIELFGMNKSEVVELKRLQVIFIRSHERPRSSQPSGGGEAIDQQLGFNHKIVDSVGGRK